MANNLPKWQIICPSGKLIWAQSNYFAICFGRNNLPVGQTKSFYFSPDSLAALCPIGQTKSNGLSGYWTLPKT